MSAKVDIAYASSEEIDSESDGSFRYMCISSCKNWRSTSTYT